jgi:hypothetical protein
MKQAPNIQQHLFKTLNREINSNIGWKTIFYCIGKYKKIIFET